MSKHTVTSFDEELTHIDRLIRDMGDLAGSMVGAAIRSLVLSDNALARWTRRSASYRTTSSWTPASASWTTARSR